MSVAALSSSFGGSAMKTFEQLELKLWQTLQEAQAVPEDADLDLLWDELETASSLK